MKDGRNYCELSHVGKVIAIGTSVALGTIFATGVGIYYNWSNKPDSEYTIRMPESDEAKENERNTNSDLTDRF